jgi:sporulation protein YlmC with PRC-barrel domain
MLLGCLCCLVPKASVRADDAPTSKETRTEIHFDSVVPATQLFDMPVVLAQGDSGGNREAVGIIRDLLIDVNSGTVPFAVVRPLPEKSTLLWVLPISTGKMQQVGHEAAAWELGKEDLARLKSTKFEASALPVNQDQATAWLHAFDQPLPWAKGTIQKEPAQFDSLRGLFWQTVIAPTGEKLGTVTEFVLDLPAQRLAYTLVTPAGVSAEKAAGPQDERPRLLIPLSAYVKSDQDRTWLLELPRKELDVEKRVAPNALPQEMPRTWIEYVSVRYGADVEKGIQPVQQPAKSQKDR